MKRNARGIVIVLAIAVIIAGCFYVYYGLGRTASRIGGKTHRQVLIMPVQSKFISISFDKRDGSTVKDVTFLATDTFHYTQEFKDISPLEGVIRWVPYGTGSDVIQSRGLSRWTGDVVNLELPEDFKEMLGVDIGYSGSDERVKNMTYLSTEG